jgi:cytoskeletal protein CcmA (bactofilin family)
MLWRAARKSESKNAAITAFIDEGSEIEGKYTFTGTGTILLNGKLQGEIVSTDVVIVGEKAAIHASIRAESVLIMGEVVGNVRATGRIELKGTARMYGDLDAPVVVLEEGVLFEGQCRMGSSRSEEPGQGLAVVPLKR